jgi:hypothetical protein
MASFFHNARSLVSELGGVDRTVPWSAILAAVTVIYFVLRSIFQSAPRYPTINDTKGSWTSIPAKKEYVQDALTLLREGYRKVRLRIPVNLS